MKRVRTQSVSACTIKRGGCKRDAYRDEVASNVFGDLGNELAVAQCDLARAHLEPVEERRHVGEALVARPLLWSRM